MEKGVIALVLVFALFMTGMIFYVLTESKNSTTYGGDEVPYSNIAPGVFYKLTPQSILDGNDIEFWSKHRLVEKKFTIETKFGQTKEENNLFNYTISNSEDCQREFDKKNYTIPFYYQTTGIGPTKYNIHSVRTCWIESVTPINMECEGTEKESCLYFSKVNCICLYASEI